VAAYYPKHSHSWVYLWTAGHHAKTGNGGKMDHNANCSSIGVLVMERAFITEEIKEEFVSQACHGSNRGTPANEDHELHLNRIRP
jgi:hypothetical protein